MVETAGRYRLRAGRVGAMVGEGIAVAVTLLFSAHSLATTCIQNIQDFSDVDEVRNYRVSSAGVSALSGITSDELIRSVIAGAEVWNEQANSGSLKYLGTTSLTDSPGLSTHPDCALGYNLVRVNTGQQGSCLSAYVDERCYNDQKGEYERFVLTINKYADHQGTEIPWAADYPQIGCGSWQHPLTCFPQVRLCEKDLRQTITHEFGHTFNLAHTDPAVDGPGPTMWPALDSDFDNTRKRDLHEWDKLCVETIAGTRDASGGRNYVYNGTIYSWASIISGTIPHFSVGLDHSGGSWVFSYGWQNSDELHFALSAGTTQGVETTDKWDASPTLAVFREFDEDNTRLTYVEEDDYPTSQQHEPLAVTRLRYERSSDAFQGGDVSGTWRVCTNSGCTSTSYAYSPYAMAVAYDFDEGEDLIAWANQTRLDDAADREIWISTDVIPNNRLKYPYKTGIRTSVGPGVTCKDSTSNPNCIVAWVDVDDPKFWIKVKRFSTSSGTVIPYSGVYTVSSVNAITANRIAAFHHNGYFYLAFKNMLTQNIVVYRSSTGTSWSLFNGNLGFSVNGPTAASFWDGSNMISSVR